MWTSSQADYSQGLAELVENTCGLHFDLFLSLSDQTPSEDKDFFVKNMELLIGEGQRSEKDIIFLDTEMGSYTNRLTNGIYVPLFRASEYHSDSILKTLLKYLVEFTDPLFAISDVRAKIKTDFNLLGKFNSYK
jgi:hypothetical protein